MKKNIFLAMILTGILLITGCNDNKINEEKNTKDTKVVAEDYIGTWYWYSGRPTVEVTKENKDYKIFVSWGSSAFETSEWNYKCNFNEETTEMECEGSRVDLIYKSEDDKIENIIYKNGKAIFAINSEGKMTWNDKKENAGEDVVLEKTNSDKE